MGSSKPRSRPAVALPVKLSLPIVLVLCIACFYGGYLFGGKPLANMPDIRVPVTTAGEAARSVEQTEEEEQPAAGKAGGEGGGTGAEETRRQLGGSEEPKPPAVRPVEHGESGEGFISDIPFQVLSWQPRAILYPGFAPPEKCDDIVALAKQSLSPSGLALRKGETAETTKDIRTSSGTFLSSHGDPDGALAWVENKMAKVTMVPVSHGEAYNILRYEIGQKYNSHYDTFNPEEYGPQSSQRIASFLLYLTDVEEGGETMFPYEGFRNMNIGYDYKQCIGLTVKPRKGDALLFWSVFPNGTIDPTALHGSCPVIRGQKFVATKWIRDKPTRLW